MISRSRSWWHVGGAFLVAVGLVAGGAAPGCSEQLPVSISVEEAGPTPPTWGLDRRPVSATCKGTEPGAGAAKISFERVTPVTFDHPVDVVEHGGLLYIVQQGETVGGIVSGAVVRALAPDGSAAPTVIDVSSRTVSGGEAGLLGLAFHPKFAENHFAYLYYTAPHPQQPPPAGVVFQSVLARYESHDGGITLDPATEKRLLVIDQPFANHNGGTIAFGNDGFLYWGLGDGGSGGDPNDNAQNKDRLLGKMLRIDVDGGDPYAIPPTNPFAAGGGRPEVYALGLRNPYRFTFDRPTGDLWAGDVGQSTREEIDKIVLGGNYGWNVREGKVCFKPMTGCPTEGLIDPVVDHGRSEATAIVGGVVYHGSKIPALTGKYVYGDTGTGFFFAFSPTSPAPVPERLERGLPNTHPVSIALDQTGEIVLTDYTGILWRIAPPAPPPPMVAMLSDTGCADATDTTKPASGLFPYDVNVPQWADGAVAERFLSVPEGQALLTQPDGRLELPAGSVAVRTFRNSSRPIETQLLVRRPDSSWGAFSYVWNADGKDATLASGDGRTCFACHNDAAGVTLGLEAAQLDRVFAYADRSANILSTLEHLGMLSAPIAKGSYAALSPLGGYDTLERRSRSYLHANCASCHRGGDPANLDLRVSTPFADTRSCNVATKDVAPFGGQTRLVPGHPEASAIFGTMSATGAAGAGRMPPLASAVPHDAALTVIGDWIRSVPGCP